MTNPKGTVWESKILPTLRRAWPNAERMGSRARHLGDFAHTGNYVVEAKDHQTITLAAFIDQAKRAAERVGGGTPVVIIKRRRKNVLNAYVVYEFGDWIKEREQCSCS